MTAMTKLPKIHYADSFNFIKSFLEFSPAGLPVDPSVCTYYQRRITPQYRPEVIGFSVFLHAIWQCFAPVISSIRLSGINSQYQPEWIAAFWTGQAPISIAPITQPTDREPIESEPMFSCQVIDLRNFKLGSLLALKTLLNIDAPKAAVFVVTDQALPDTQLQQQTPFGVVSFFNKDEWEAYCENLV